MKLTNKLEPFDAILDARTPKEFEEAHIPNALNFAVFNDEEHALVGTTYKQESPFKAKILGSSLACKNIASFLEKSLKDKTTPLHPKNKLLVYCARGGKRSSSLGIILEEVGFQVQKLEGGFKAYRNMVLNALKEPFNKPLIVLDGLTGCGKTELIKHFSSWSIDLENLAKHYGSSFGNPTNAKRPTQKMFENLLFDALKKKNSEPLLLIEKEPKSLGGLIIPNPLFNAYQNSPYSILIVAPLEHRIKRLVDIYSNLKESVFKEALHTIKPYTTRTIIKELERLYEHRDLEKIAEILTTKYYDLVYKKSSHSHTICFNTLEQCAEMIMDFRESVLKKHLE
ncbi:tRNA 2-selenouridine(34) synthase MnmH [Helicobacter cetorum]|uniref:tRNA 2-selenouridine synthase n=1 Tax=Helicobacter cetorum (strain ATCC BAA-540 / CCUG 52418 / MIT 99-5656) TaxID=1163745 RepID=I0EQT7_HELCM|nr:tRNA 2-selenouridine(34) synthase MnmH [Helicobacter cetorum]AFI05306.1 tRNA 2-selenouridine synthase [Helicobacter cetorum MIT 99-5656]